MSKANPAIMEICVTSGIGYAEAEELLRMRAKTDAKAAKAVAELDVERAEAKQAVKAVNETHCKALGLSMDQVRDLVNRIAADPRLESWLMHRVHRTIGQEKPLAHDE